MLLGKWEKIVARMDNTLNKKHYILKNISFFIIKPQFLPTTARIDTLNNQQKKCADFIKTIAND